MRSELAERLLDKVMGWDTVQFIENTRDVQALSQLKYDEYGNYGPGAKFVENLAMWLDQFPKDRRQTAMDFVLERLVFVSEAQMQHLISLVYPEIIEPTLRARIATSSSVPAHRVAEINARADFRSLRRRSLILGASDGARLDRLRRSAPDLSHEQFLQNPTPAPEQIGSMVTEARKALGVDAGNACPFAHVFLVDDFAGSGKTLLRDGPDGPSGKLIRLKAKLDAAAEAGLVEPDIPVTAVLYFGTEQAERQVRCQLASSGLDGWSIRSVQLLAERHRVDRTDPDMTALCHELYDDSTDDPHRGRTPIGYSDCALPLVLSHNTPNNSVCLLWMDTRKPDSLGLRALFPRYERHHPDRP